ncbi:MAG: DUF3617 family protein [Pseudomonadota bacterium]|nr:DUF3617 family protein [Pseudomonadota bacterium]
MKRTLFLAALIGLGTTPALAGDLKPGLWLINTTMEGPNLPPQMRAQTQQECLDADQANNIVDALRADWDAEGCELGEVERDGDNLSWEATCKQASMNSRMKGSVELHSETHYTSHITMMMPGHEMQSISEGKWAAASCSPSP